MICAGVALSAVERIANVPRARSSCARGCRRWFACSTRLRGRAAVRCARSCFTVCDGPPPPVTTCHGGVVREPIVNDSSMVALKLKWIVMNTILMLTLTLTPARTSMRSGS